MHEFSEMETGDNTEAVHAMNEVSAMGHGPRLGVMKEKKEKKFGNR